MAEIFDRDASPPMAGSVWLTRAELADRWKMPLATLDQWASRGHGPRYALFGRHARYRLSDVIAWENKQLEDDPEPDPQPDPEPDPSEPVATT